MKQFLICVLLSLALALSVSATEYKDAPLPHYDEEKEYGWITNVPIDNPDYPHSIMKVWQIYNQRVVFIDKFKDGTCDVVGNFMKTGEKTPDGKDLYQPLPGKTCDEAETMIRMFLERDK